MPAQLGEFKSLGTVATRPGLSPFYGAQNTCFCWEKQKWQKGRRLNKQHITPSNFSS
jgi:hypothetical protein